MPQHGAQDIFVMDADGTNLKRLTNDPSDDFWATWSPDEQHIAFTTDRDDIRAVYIMERGRDGPEAVLVRRRSSHPSWIP